MKKSIVTALLLCFCTCSFAKHIKGGWIQYEYIKSSGNNSDYKVTIYMFVSCTINGPTDEVYLGVFDAVTHTLVYTASILTSGGTAITKNSFDPCLSDPPSVCYTVYKYVTTITVANNANGYILATQEALRVDGIVNISNSGIDGITITANIPGTINGVDYHINTSPFYLFKDTAVICYSGPFTYQFSATDVDGDSLSYEFGDGLNVYNPGRNTSIQPPASPPYPSLSYTGSYSGTSPLGPGVTINPVTGIISGTAPAVTGPYVVAVYVKEWRKGVLINTTKKELQIDVANCSLTGASLNPVYINCDNFTFNFQNESTSSNVSTYFWNFGVPNVTNDTSTQATPSYTYADTGTYTIKLKVKNTGGCSDSTTAAVKVYPGFAPAFTVAGSCYQSVFQFTDQSYVKYGFINSRSWDFGDNTTTADTSSASNPTWLYSAPGTVTVNMKITSSKGCSATTSQQVVVNNKPAIYLPFTDTLICSNDTLPLKVVTTAGANIKWSPAYNLISSGTSTLVYPYDSTVYTVTVKDKGCIDSARVNVNVLPYITVSLLPDTAICKTDSITLRPVSYALSYLWTESGEGQTLSSYSLKYPNAAPQATTNYYVKANLGHCQDSAHITVYVAPYPVVTVSSDVNICYGKTTRLQASTNAPYYTWSPSSSLLPADTLAPLAAPQRTTAYLFTAQDTGYCKKPVTDTVVVTVIPPVRVNAGNDTFAVINQPVQLNAVTNAASPSYAWSPIFYLDNSTIYNPVATVTSTTVDSINYTITVTTPDGCTGEDNIVIRLFKTAPDIFIPTAFTPNGDGTNDQLTPIVAGLQKFNYFRVFNRWGQLLFQTSQTGKGWDGSLNGIMQPAGAYVFMAQGIDYLGRNVFRKGTVVLIR